jgi:hypothetical protein
VCGSAGRVMSGTGGVLSPASAAPGALVTCVAEAAPGVPLEERVLVPARAADALAVELGERVNLGATSAACLEHCLRPLEGIDAPACTIRKLRVYTDGRMAIPVCSMTKS